MVPDGFAVTAGEVLPVSLRGAHRSSLTRSPGGPPAGWPESQTQAHRRLPAQHRSGLVGDPTPVAYARFDHLPAGSGAIFASSTPQTLVAGDP